jgi:hypothetical protein
VLKQQVVAMQQAERQLTDELGCRQAQVATLQHELQEANAAAAAATEEAVSAKRVSTS